MGKKPVDIREMVSGSYAGAVERGSGAGGRCCSGPAPESLIESIGRYDPAALEALSDDVTSTSFGCGDPVSLAGIEKGETILDLGSGAGLDLILAGRMVGPRGKVIGVDMTAAMRERAEANAMAAGLSNVEVREGVIEELPVESASVDLVISNCVINLSPEKARTFAEIRRVLKPGGRFSISDIVVERMPPWIREDGVLYSACISGATSEADYLAGLEGAGLVHVRVADRLVFDRDQLGGLLGPSAEGGCCCGPTALSVESARRAVEDLDGQVASIRVEGERPGEGV